MLNNFRKKIMLIGMMMIIGGGIWWWMEPTSRVSTQSGEATQKAVYFCPMHPSITSDKPGRCPICHMDLQKSEENKHETEASEKKEKKILFYRHPMQPEVTSPVPAKDNMGMDYIPVYDEETNNGESNVSGRTSFRLSSERQQMIGVTTTTVQKKNLTYEIRASGKVAFDPELFTAIDEYLQAIQSERLMSKSSFKDLRDQAQSMVSSALTKLKLMGLSSEQIAKLAKGGKSPRNLLLPELSVWIYAEVFEYEISGLKSGQKIEVLVPSLPGKMFYGTLSSISPILNSPSRTFRVRAEVPDPNKELRPDTFVNVKITIDLGEKIAIPLDAALHAGDQHFVFIKKGEGLFEPRSVMLGMRTKEFYEVISGLEEGETVVTAANFFIDSESRLKAVLEKMKTGESGGTASPHEHH